MINAGTRSVVWGLVLQIFALTTGGAERIAILGDERGESQENMHLLSELTAASLVERFDCDVIVRFESSSVVQERVIDAGQAEAWRLPAATAADKLVYIRGMNGVNFSVKHGDIRPGMGERTQLAGFFGGGMTTNVKDDGSGSLQRSTRQIADKLAAEFGLKPKPGKGGDVKPEDKKRKFSVAVMTPKIARIAIEVENGQWNAEAESVQELIEAGLPEEFPQVQLLDRNNIGEILREKHLSILGGDAEGSMGAMRLLGADFLVRPVVALVGRKGAPPSAKDAATMGLEITLLVIRCADGVVCSSVPHRGPFTSEAVSRMLPLLQFPVGGEEGEREASGDAQRRAWEADFYLGLAIAKSYQSSNNSIFQSEFNFKCCQAAYSLGPGLQATCENVLIRSHVCHTQEYPDWRRHVKFVDLRRYHKEAMQNAAAARLFPRLQGDTKRFYDSVGAALDLQQSPRSILWLAYWKMISGDGERSLSLLHEFRGERAVADLIRSDTFFFTTGMHALAKLDRFADCVEWLDTRGRFGPPEMLLMVDCFAALGDKKSEFRVLKGNRAHLGVAKFYTRRLIELAHEQDQTAFLFRYIMDELTSWDYNEPGTQWELYRLMLARGERELAKDIVCVMRARCNYSPVIENFQKWEKAAKELGLKDHGGAQRKLPFELNPIGKQRVVEVMPFGPGQDEVMLGEYAQQVATLMGCSVKLYPPLPTMEVVGVHDLQERFYYTQEMINASLLAKPPEANVIERILVSDRTIVRVNSKTGRPGPQCYSDRRNIGTILSMSPIPRYHGFRRVDDLTLSSLALSNLRNYVMTHVETGHLLGNFTRNIPDFTGSNGYFSIGTSFRASLGQTNSGIYQKIEWEEYQEQYQQLVQSMLVDERERHAGLTVAVASIRKALEEAEPKAKLFGPGEVTKEIEALRSYR